MAAATLAMREDSRPLGTISVAAATAFSTSIFTDSRANGPAHRAQTAISPKTPAEFLMTEAAESTVADASEIRPPTTGRLVEMTVRVALMATASTLPLMRPVMPI